MDGVRNANAIEKWTAKNDCDCDCNCERRVEMRTQGLLML